MLNDTTIILGTKVNVASIQSIKLWLMGCVKNQRVGYVCAANVHMLMEAKEDKNYQQVINNAALVVSDGRPLYWIQKRRGHNNAEQIRGTSLMLTVCKLAADNQLTIGLYGSTPNVMTKLQENLLTHYPNLKIGCAISPPFSNTTNQQTQQDLEQITQSNINFLFVALGCPKQEKWMAKHQNSLKCMQFGVGAAFDFISGTRNQAPRWMQKVGLEWVFRLLCQPKRLFKRYALYNPKFIYYYLVKKS